MIEIVLIYKYYYQSYLPFNNRITLFNFNLQRFLYTNIIISLIYLLIIVLFYLILIYKIFNRIEFTLKKLKKFIMLINLKDLS